jgi:Cu+-exporting ATPase
VIETIRFPIAGMTCASCVNRLTRALRRLDGVEGVEVDLRHETVTVRRVPSRVSTGELGVAVAEAGYAADLEAATVLPHEAQRPAFLRRLLARGS